MRTQDKLKRAGLLGIVPLAALGIWGGVALASNDNSTATTTSFQGVISQQATSASAMDDFIANLAANLGIDEQKLRDALKTTSIQQVDKALADGEITADEATRIKEAINSGTAPLFGLPGGFEHGHRGGPGGPGAGHADADGAALATFLGIDQATLRSELQVGKTLAQEAEAHGKSREQLKAFLTQQFSTKIDAEQQAGRITSDQAATMKQKFADALDSVVDRAGGEHHGPDHFRGPGSNGGNRTGNSATPRGGA